MGRSRALLSVVMASLAGAAVSHAATLEWSGTLTVKIGPLPRVEHRGTGVATVNASGGLGHLDTLRWAGGLSYAGGNNVPECIPITDPGVGTTTSIRATGVRLGTASLNGISGGPPLGSKNTGILLGRMKICTGNPGCPSSLVIPFGTPSGNIGIGVGGTFTFSGSVQGSNVQLSLVGAPWTIGVASIVVTTTTDNGGVATYTATIQGFVHGPASGTSSAAAISGVIQAVTPVVVHSSACTPDTLHYKVGWAEVKLRFIPEPGMLLLLGVNLVALVAIGRRRMRP